MTTDRLRRDTEARVGCDQVIRCRSCHAYAAGGEPETTEITDHADHDCADPGAGYYLAGAACDNGDECRCDTDPLIEMPGWKRAEQLLEDRGGGALVLGADGTLYVVPFVDGRISENQVRAVCEKLGIDGDDFVAGLTRARPTIQRFTGDAGAITVYPGKGILSRETPGDPWTLVIFLGKGKAPRRIPLGPCICHRVHDCPAGAQDDTALRILRGDHPDLYTPEPR